MVLRAQLSDWKRFRLFQRNVRARYQHKPFSSFEDEVRERRQRHGLDGSVSLLLDLNQQSQLQNWIEFQNYQLKRLEQFDKERDEWKK